MVDELLPMAPPCFAELLVKEESSTEMSLLPMAVMAPPMDCKFWLPLKMVEETVTLLLPPAKMAPPATYNHC